MDRLEAMTILLAAVDTGSLSAASRELRFPLTTVSRRVSELEEHLKIRLLLRGNRKLALTDAGRSYVASCRRIMEEIAEAERVAAGEFLTPRGELTISVSQIMGRVHVMPVVEEFLRAYPDISMRVMLNDRRVDLVEEDVDLALRVGELPDSSMIAVRVGLFRRVLCASPAYLKSRNVPKKPSDLSSHDCVAYDRAIIPGTGGTNWEFGSKETLEIVTISSRLVVNSVEAAASAAIAGSGVARMPWYLADGFVKSGLLLTLLEAYEPPVLPLSLIYPGQPKVPLKLRAFLEFSIPRLRERFGS
ncbi:LysR family transcriptional regulator [Pararhizobium sp. BT-229]|uniref:LysR family transcriptional regulator n=1 Tax=Pararhizobium sp. BT-229 TaxID=2986923 RepID=UPI0021F78AB4|nr:LysR family transcriptional regulator [Pararhizobium sp. BT-229]MCV9961894.1 LysR family transcriptional regulator [Pararhizobium sp. BT-229]